MYRIVSDSGCDIFELPGTSFATVPLTINTDHDVFVDDCSLNTHAMLETLLAYKGRSYTACPATEAWLKAFDHEDGSTPDELYVVTLTSNLSGTFNSANVAKDIYLESHPETKAIVIDSLSVGPEMRLILEWIVECKTAGKSFEDISSQAQDYCAKARLFFAFKSLHNLAENGRVSKLAASAAGLLGISVCGTASAEGNIKPLTKHRGDKQVISRMLSLMRDAGYHGGKVRITHTENPALAERIMLAIRDQFPSADVLYYPVRGLCTFYCERGGICIACETDVPFV